VRHDAAHLVRVVDLRLPVPGAVARVERVHLREQAHGRVVEEAAYYRGAADEPGVIMLARNQTRLL
jgi:hypothetical protein